MERNRLLNFIQTLTLIGGIFAHMRIYLVFL